MADESLRELERTVAVSPDDPGARLRLASGLARAGRRREALSHLEHLGASGPLPLEAASLGSVLWREELAALEPRMAVPGAHQVDKVEVDPEGGVLAWSSGAGSLKVADLATGEVLASEPCLVRDVIFVRGRRVFALDDMGARLLEVDVRGPVPEKRALAVEPFVRLLDVSPTGDRVLVQDRDVDGVYEWPTLAPVVRRRCGSVNAIVDWSAGLFVAVELGGRSVEVCPIAHGNAPGVSLPLSGRVGQLASLGHGLAAQSPGLTLHSLTARWRLPLVTANVELPAPSLAPDGRGVRVVLGGTPVRFDVDLETGQLVRAPEGVERLARAAQRHDGQTFWHPRADVCAVMRAGSAFFELRATDGSVALGLPANTAPERWTSGGRQLLTLRGAGSLGQVWLELWRAPG